MPEPSTPKRSRRGKEADGVTPPVSAETPDAPIEAAKRRNGRTAWPERPRRENADNSIGIDRPPPTQCLARLNDTGWYADGRQPRGKPV